MYGAKWRSVVVSLAALIGAAGVNFRIEAQTYLTSPPWYESLEGPGSSNTLVRNQGNPRTMQIIYDASLLIGLIDHELTSIAYRLTNSLPGSYPLIASTWSEYHIEIGPSVSVLDSTGVFADNFSGPSQVVRSGSLTAPPLSWPVGTPPQPSPWGLEIVFDTPYRYTGGDLALLITHPGSNNPDQGNSLLDATNASSPEVGVLYTAWTANSMFASSGASTPFVPIIRLQGRPIAVPEPASCILGLLAGGWYALRRPPRKSNRSANIQAAGV